MRIFYVAIFLFFGAISSKTGRAGEEIDSAQYGVSPGGMPLAIALEKGFFKEAGADIEGIRSSPGGGTDIRMLLGGNLPYTETSIAAVIAAVKTGADLKIISEPVHTVSEVLWVAMPSSSINSVKDLKGKRVSFSNPQSTTQALDFLLIEAGGFSQTDVTLTATGGFAQGLTSLENGGVDLAVIAEPMYSLSGNRYKPIFWAHDLFPPTNNVVGVTSGTTAREKPALLKGIIAGRRKATEFMVQNREESAGIIAKAYKIDPSIVRKVMDELLDHGNVKGIPYWGLGNFNFDDMNNMVKAMKLVGAMDNGADYHSLIDESFLPDDLKTKK